MRGLRKRAIALAAVAALAMTSLVGCAESFEFDDSEVVSVVGDSEITAGMANFYIRYQQASVESMYMSMLGEDMWSMEISEDQTYEDVVKEDAMEALQELYILEDHMEDYDVTLTDAELTSIEEAAKAFDKANTDDAKNKISADIETVKELLKLITISEKMSVAIKAKANTEVSDEDAAQKALSYVLFETSTVTDDGTETEMSEDEIADVKKEAETFLAKAKANGDLKAYAEEAGVESHDATFDKESTDMSEEMIAAADVLGEGEFAEVVETEGGFCVIQLTSLLDRDATDAKKLEIVEERKTQMYDDVVSVWKDETEITTHQKVIDKISLQALEVVPKTEE